MNVQTAEKFQFLMDKKLRKVFEAKEKYNDLKGLRSQFFDVIGSDRPFEEFNEVGALPDIPAFNGRLEYLNYSPGYNNKIEPAEFAGAVIYERKLLDDKQYPVFASRADELLNSMERVKEKKAVRILSNAFSSAFDFQVSEEGVSLCNSSHTTKSGVSTSSGFGNSGTSAMSKTSVAATRILMRKFRNDIGERIEVNATEIWCPDNLADTAEEIVSTKNGLYSAEGTTNTQYGRYKVMPWLRLDDTSTTNWFMVDGGLRKKFAKWVERIKPETGFTVDFETFMSKYKVYSRFGYGFLDWRFIYGHNL
jgi:hypothetical protein